MKRKLTHIPNPNKISNMEHAFLEEKNEFIKKIKPSSQTEEGFKGHMISMPNSFASTLTKYLIENPTEGSKSSFIVRVVAEYIKTKSHSF